MCNSSHLSNDFSEGSFGKRHKRVDDINLLEISNKSVLLPSVIKSWISHIGVDVEKYQRALYQVENKLKKRYYRLPSNPRYEGCQHECLTDSLRHSKFPATQCPDTTCSSRGSDEIPSVVITGEQHERTNMKQSDYSRTISGSSKKVPHIGNHNVVKWLRDVELYECYESIPKEAVGLNASSAAVVDSLRLRELSEEDGTKWILDMCCAPGGKLLGIVSCLKRLTREGIKWKVIGLDVVKRRLDVCASFLRKENQSGGIDVSLVQSRGQDFTEFGGASMINRFDRVMVDAECTHEGSLRSVIRTLKYWGSSSLESRFTQDHAESIISNQRELLIHAIHLVRPGGLVIYSTCSLHNEQNELLVSGVLQEFDNVKLQQLPNVFCECCSMISDRIDTWPATSTESLLKEHCPPQYFPDRSNSTETNCANQQSPVCVRFSPLDSETDGIFIAALRKLRN